MWLLIIITSFYLIWKNWGRKDIFSILVNLYNIGHSRFPYFNQICFNGPPN